MGLDLRLQHKMAQQLVMTPQLQQAIKLLQLSHLEMAQALREELAQNPLLEEFDGGAEQASAGEHGPTEHPASGAEAPPELHAEGTDAAALSADLAALAPGYAPSGGGARTEQERDFGLEGGHVRPTSLTEHLHWQLQMADLAGIEREAAAYLVQEVDDDGYLPADALVGCAQAFALDEAPLARALSCVQSFDPSGVGARSLQECLLLQARALQPQDPVLLALLEHHLPALQARAFGKLARALKLEREEVVAAVQRLARLEPRPGRAFSYEAPAYIVPDLFVRESCADGHGLHVSVNEEGLPKLCLSPYYGREQTQQLGGKERSYVQEKMRAASWLLRSVYMRQRTLVRVMHSILKFQRPFFTQGGALRPLVLRDVAHDLGLHESTISRVTSGKYVHTPQGTFELKFFFSSTVRGAQGGDVASEDVRQKIMQFIAREDKNEPLSDQKIVDLLRGHDIAIARRTVAKYRKMLNKQPSSSRRREF